MSAIGKMQQLMNREEAAETAASDDAGSRLQITIFALVGIVTAGLIAFALLMARRISVTLRDVLVELSAASDANASAARISTSSQVLAQGRQEQTR